MSNQSNIYIDPGHLPMFSIAQAINLAYTEAVVRLSNALNLDEFLALRDFTFRFHVVDPNTGEKRVIVQRGGEEDTIATDVDFETALSILAIVRLKDYMASYGRSRQVSIFLSGVGESGMSDLDRLLVLFEERPEFGMYSLSNIIKEDTIDTTEEEEDQKEEKNLPAPEEGKFPKGTDGPVEVISYPVIRSDRVTYQ